MDTSIKNNQKFKIKYTKEDGEEVRRFGILTEDCRGFGNRQKTIDLFYITMILIKKDIDTQPIGRYYNG